VSAGSALTGTARRLVGVDVARCLALLGMMATHILGPVAPGGGVAWPQALAGGRSSALFAVLAGLSMALMTGGTAPHRGVERLADCAGLAFRALLIGTLGLWLGQLDTHVAVILAYYAVLFVLGLPFLRLGAGTLLALSAMWCVAAPVFSHLLRRILGSAGPTVPTTEGLPSVGAFVTDLTLTGYYPAVPWMTYLLAGLALGRLDLARPVVATRVAAAGAAVAVGAWAASKALTSRPAVRDALTATSGLPGDWQELSDSLALGLHGVTPTGSWWWLAVVAPHSGTPLDLAHTTGFAAAVVGVCLLLSRWAPRMWAVVFGAGAMTLTLYTAHVVLLVPELWPDSTPENYARHASLALAAGAVLAGLRRRGPLEALVRSASASASRVVLAGRTP
jgi:uncharacterized membrane protein